MRLLGAHLVHPVVETGQVGGELGHQVPGASHVDLVVEPDRNAPTRQAGGVVRAADRFVHRDDDHGRRLEAAGLLLALLLGTDLVVARQLLEHRDRPAVAVRVVDLDQQLVSEGRRLESVLLHLLEVRSV
ncbi:hypothetical protein D3C72_1671770 [compost metagenome]